MTTAYTIRNQEQKQALEDNIQRYLDLGIIEEGPSDWKMSLFVVKQHLNSEQQKLKKSNSQQWIQSWRVVQDFQPLNACVIPEENTLPLIPDVLRLAAGNSVFSLINLSKAFFHCLVKESDRQYIGIPHESMNLRARRMPMGYSNSPSIWQRNMNEALLRPMSVFMAFRKP